MISAIGSSFADARNVVEAERDPDDPVDRTLVPHRCAKDTQEKQGDELARDNLEESRIRSGARRIASPTDYLVLVSESPELDHLRRGKWFHLRFARPLIPVRYPHRST